MRIKSAVVILAWTSAMLLGGLIHPARSFDVSIHEGITYAALSDPGLNFTFLRRAVFDDIADEHEQIDGGLSGARDERHFDDCEFDGATEYIWDRYADIRAALVDGRVWDATDQFGNALHPVMDLYSHSNWVELGFPLSDDPSKVTQSDLMDLSGAQVSLSRGWRAPPGGGVVRGDILIANDDWNIPVGWSISPNGGGNHVPTLIDPQGRTRGRLLMTGEGTGDDECDIYRAGTTIREYDGLEHETLAKDNPGSSPTSRDRHAKALALAKLQTSYEWCRLVKEAGLSGSDGLLLATWVRSGGNPHPAGTPCARASPGPNPVTVTIESVRVLDSGDDDDSDPGEIQIAVVLYDDSEHFRRSIHATNRGGRMSLDDGELVPTAQLPAPLTLCVPLGQGATFTLHGWDNDDQSGDLYASDFDDKDDDDELLVGFQRRFGAQLPSGIQIARSDDLEVRYRVTRGPSGLAGPGGFICPPLTKR